MELVTVNAVVTVRMQMGTLRAHGKFSGMAVTANFTGIATNQPLLLAGVGRVAAEAEGGAAVRKHMVQCFVKTGHDVRVASQTQISSAGICIMTTAALALLERLMLCTA